MPNQFAINTTAHPRVGQILVNTPTGLVDYKAQQVGGKITVASHELAKADTLRKLRGPNGHLYFVET